MSGEDRAAPVRGDQQLPRTALAAYLREHLPDLRGDLEIGQFPQGFSNLTYLLRIGATELVLRRPPFGTLAATAHDMQREYRVLSGVSRIYPLAPRALLYCADPAVIGAPFYVMERRHGTVLRARPGELPAVDPDVMRRLAAAMIANLAHIHQLDYAAAGLADLGRPEGYTARQIHGWAKRYAAAATDPQPGLETALAWLAARIPAAPRAALIHNDYKLDNLLLDSHDLTRLVAVLDWEMCTLGDPRMDLGTTLGYWIEPGDPPPLVDLFGLTTLAGCPNRAEAVAAYQTASNDQFDPLFYYVYGVVKVGVILQQLYARYRRGETADPRYATLGEAVGACSVMASQALAKQRISALFA